jgi:uncharacterized protein (PEP-CTERM system associated)
MPSRALTWPTTRRRNPAAVRGRLRLPAVLLVASAASFAASAQDSGPTRQVSVSASVASQLSYVVDSRRGGLSGGDLVAELQPGIRLDSRSGRIVGSLSYGMNLVQHTEAFDGERVQNQLDARLSAEAIERWMYVDATATVTQQAQSAFGVQSASGSTQNNPNRIEVANITLSPYVRGMLGSAVTYEARLTANAINGRRSKTADSTLNSGSISLSSAVPGALVTWGLSAVRQVSEYRVGRRTQNDRATATVAYNPDVDLTLTLRGGQESNDIANIDRRSYNNWGGGLTWRPSPRTRAQFDADERYFGRSYRVVIDHRLASSSIQFSSSRDASNGSGAAGAGQQITLYDALFQLLASDQPDPVLRDQEVRARLLAQGLDPNASVAGGFINTAITVQERHQLTLTYAGRRLGASVQGFISSSKTVDAAALANGDGRIRQQGYVTSASYQLTPSTSVALSGSRLLTKGTDTQAGTELKSLTLSLSSQLARRTSAALSARYSVFNSATAPYREAALVASLSQRF